MGVLAAVTDRVSSYGATHGVQRLWAELMWPRLAAVRWIVDEDLVPLVLASPAEPPQVAASLALPFCLQGVRAVAWHPSHRDVTGA